MAAECELSVCIHSYTQHGGQSASLASAFIAVPNMAAECELSECIRSCSTSVEEVCTEDKEPEWHVYL